MLVSIKNYWTVYQFNMWIDYSGYARDCVSRSTNMRRAVCMSRKCKKSQIIIGTKICRSLYCKTDIWPLWYLFISGSNFKYYYVKFVVFYKRHQNYHESRNIFYCVNDHLLIFIPLKFTVIYYCIYYWYCIYYCSIVYYFLFLRSFCIKIYSIKEVRRNKNN